jgi:hypothetical protein
MNSDQALQTLLDREAIRECIFRYCRGIDRADEAALLGSYWPDATDRHGPYQGSAQAFIEAALPKARGSRLIHHVGNLSIELRGPQAAVETYFLAWQRDRAADGSESETFLSGRYVDRFEKRGDEWRVAARIVVYDWIQPMGPAPVVPEAERFGLRQPVGAKQPDEPWYALLAEMDR